MAIRKINYVRFGSFYYYLGDFFGRDGFLICVDFSSIWLNVNEPINAFTKFVTSRLCTCINSFASWTHGSQVSFDKNVKKKVLFCCTNNVQRTIQMGSICFELKSNKLNFKRNIRLCTIIRLFSNENKNAYKWNLEVNASNEEEMFAKRKCKTKLK